MNLLFFTVVISFLESCTSSTAAICCAESCCCQAIIKQENAYGSVYVWKISLFTTKGTFGSVYRCNNVLYIRGVEEEEEDGEMRE